MNYLFTIAIVFFLPLCDSDDVSYGNLRVNYEKLYKAGVEAYLENRWSDCVTFIEKSLEDYFYYNAMVIKCRKKCKDVDIDYFEEVADKSLEIWNIQLLVAAKSLCLLRCRNSYFPRRSQASRETDLEFEKKTPYNYLQLCYFKIDEPEKAASCAYTFLIHNPTHEVMQTNLQYYMSVPNISVNKVKYLEAKDYQDLFLKGAQLYTDGKHKESIEIMEMSLREYLIAEDDCRAICEGPVQENVNEEMLLSVLQHYTFALRCKLKCPETLAHMYGHKHDELLSSHFNYLQFNFYKVGNLKKTCESVASYLLFHPTDETMLSNKKFYLNLPTVSSKCFHPRQEALIYSERRTAEVVILEEIDSHFLLLNISQSSPLPPPGSKQEFLENRKLGKRMRKLTKPEKLVWLERAEIAQLMNADELNGTNRVALSNLATPDECLQLVKLGEEGGVHGDGYNGKMSPHTEFEMFEGLTIARATLLARRGIISPAAASLFFNISEKARKAVEVYFELESELFFSYTHLVCRTALSETDDSRHDFSHPIHADNCVLTPTGECLREKPAYTWRDYSSIVYLNDDFEGGEFLFAKDKQTIQSTVKPSCGLMVAFSAGKENLHGVRAVRRGRRCALAMWYTLDPDYQERERIFARPVLTDLHRSRKFSKGIDVENTVSKSTLLKFAVLGKKGQKHDPSEL